MIYDYYHAYITAGSDQSMNKYYQSLNPKSSIFNGRIIIDDPQRGLLLLWAVEVTVIVRSMSIYFE